MIPFDIHGCLVVCCSDPHITEALFPEVVLSGPDITFRVNDVKLFGPAP
jgi:hypothetical protein